MTRSRAETVEEYLEALPADRRATIRALRELILKNLPEGYRESMNWGMISYEIPLERYADTYNDQPLGCIALASQKNYCTLHLNSVYQDPELRARLERGFERAGKKLDMGKACLRFRRVEDLPLDAIGEIVASVPPETLIRTYERSRRR